MELEEATYIRSFGGLGGLGVILGWWGGGGPWFDGFGGLSLVGFDLVLFTWWCFAPEGPRLPLVRARFIYSFIQWRWPGLASGLK